MKRPVLVTIIGVVAILSGIGQAVVGAVTIGLRHNAKLLADADITTNTATALGAALIVIGVLTFVFAIGLLKGSRISRALIGLTQLCSLAAGVYAVAALDSTRRSSGIGSIVGAVIVLYFLFGTDKAKAFFASKGHDHVA